MKAITKVLAGGVAIAALSAAAPAAAQYYPGYGYGYGGGVAPIINQVLGGGYGLNQQAAVNQCNYAVQARLGGGYGYGYGYGSGYGMADGRVLGVSRIQPNGEGGLTVHGVATSGRAGAYGYGYNAQPDLTWRCTTDYRGMVLDVNVRPARSTYGSVYQSVPYYGNDYSQYGYQRY